MEARICLICVELIKQRMSLGEAERNARELMATKDADSHTFELEKAIRDGNFEKLAEILDEGAENA